MPARPVTVAATERISREPSRTPVYITFAIGVVVALAFTIWKVMPREPEEAPLPQQPPSTSTSREGGRPRPRSRLLRRPKADTPTPPTKHGETPTPAEKPTEPKPRAGATKADSAPRTKEATLLARGGARSRRGRGGAGRAASRPTRSASRSTASTRRRASRAYAVIARARCAQGDLGNAKAALAQVAARDRSPVVRACGKLGVELR